jgi:hypothetical protein
MASPTMQSEMNNGSLNKGLAAMKTFCAEFLTAPVMLFAVLEYDCTEFIYIYVLRIN